MNLHDVAARQRCRRDVVTVSVALLVAVTLLGIGLELFTR